MCGIGKNAGEGRSVQAGEAGVGGDVAATCTLMRSWPGPGVGILTVALVTHANGGWQ